MKRSPFWLVAMATSLMQLRAATVAVALDLRAATVAVAVAVAVAVKSR
jgi:hypothetical protein